MESMLNRLRDTVSATVYQVTNNLSTALPGNPLTREYEIIRQIGSAGPGLCFKIYDAMKKSTKEHVSLFIMEKKTDRFERKDKEQLFDKIRHGVPQLTRLRHPSMLTIQHNLEESRDLFAFATEPVLGSLANFFDQTFTKEQSKDGIFEFYDVEIKYGLLQISEGLLFLHKDARILHRNICPENIIVNRNGIWKLAGFEFSVQTMDPNEQPYKFPAIKVIADTSLDVQANYTYSAPENFQSSNNDLIIDTSSDIFSLGMVAYTLYNKGKPFLQFNQSYQYLPEKFSNELKEKLSTSSLFNCIPEDFRKHFRLLSSIDPKLRPDAQQLSKLQIFQDVLVRTLQYFDCLFQWDSAQKTQFYRNLPDVLQRLPKRIKLRRIVNGLAKEFVNPEMVPFVLPPMFLIAKETDDNEFHTWIVPELIQVFRYKEPIQIGLFLLKNMDFIVTKFKTKPDTIKEHILPLIYRFLESDAYQIQELCLSVVPTIIHLVDFSSAKNMLLPRIRRLSLETKLLSVRVNCLICLGKIIEYLDKWLVLDDVLPLVMMMPSREPAVIMCSVGIFTLTMNSNKLGIPKEMLANKIIPFLVPLSIENGLSLQQYTIIMNLIRDMLNKIEEEQQTKIRQLDSIKVQQDSFFIDQQQQQQKMNGVLNNNNNQFDPFKFNDNNKDEDKINNNNKSLTLDDKERLAFEKEQSERLKMNENILLMSESTNKESFKKSSQSNSSQPPVPPTKDLTDLLINSNLNLMSKPIQSNNAFNSQFSSSKPNYSALDNIAIPNIGQKSSPQTLNSLKQQQQQQNHHQQSLSPMRTITMNNYSINSNNNINNSNSTKQLSKSELEEFLN